MNKFTKRYQLWQRGEGNQFRFDEFDTLEEIVTTTKYDDWYITQRVNLQIIDIGEEKGLPDVA